MSDAALGTTLAIVGAGIATLLSGIGSAIGISFQQKLRLG